MPILISAALAAIISDGLPEEIVYMPEGEHTITPTVDGKPKKITVRVLPELGEQIAASFQSALTSRQAGNVRAWFDFEHKAGAASALPTAFRYEPGVGVMASLEWTGAGRSAIEGKDFSYLSPTFLVDENGVPCGLPEKGPLAALVNEPAFRDIPRIAASDAVSQLTNAPDIMSKLILAALSISASSEYAENEAVDKIKSMQSDMTDKQKRIAELEAELSMLKGEKEAVMASLAKAAKDRAETLVQAAVADGRIAPKDEDKQSKFLAKIESGDTFAEEILAQLPKLNQALSTPIVAAASVAAAANQDAELTPYEKVQAAFAAESAQA